MLWSYHAWMYSTHSLVCVLKSALMILVAESRWLSLQRCMGLLVFEPWKLGGCKALSPNKAGDLKVGGRLWENCFDFFLGLFCARKGSVMTKPERARLSIVIHSKNPFYPVLLISMPLLYRFYGVGKRVVGDQEHWTWVNDLHLASSLKGSARRKLYAWRRSFCAISEILSTFDYRSEAECRSWCRS